MFIKKLAMSTMNIKDALDLIDFALQRINFMEFDDLLDDILESIRIQEDPNTPANLSVTDKLRCYNIIWSRSLEALYKHFLPHINYSLQPNQIEVTPYTIMLCRIVPRTLDKNELFQILFGHLEINLDEFESDPKKYLMEENIDITPIDNLPPNVRPKNIWETLALLLRLMNFPPLNAIGEFFLRVSEHLQESINKLATFVFTSGTKIPSFTLPRPLFYTMMPISNYLIEKYPLSILAQHASLEKFKTELFNYANRAQTMTLPLDGLYICPCCGKEMHGIDPPLSFHEWRLIVADRPIVNAIGYILLDEIQDDFLLKQSKILESVVFGTLEPQEINAYILVEGQTEVNAMSILAWKTGSSLWSTGIKIVDCGGKSGVKKKFEEFKKIYPDIPLVSLLDEDAQTEHLDIDRMTRGNKNKYASYRIPHGTIEDAFSLKYCVQALNRIYPDSNNEIELSDFDTNCSFLDNINEFLFEKRQVDFAEKAAFGRWVAFFTPGDEIPPELKEVIDKAVSFIKASLPLKLKSMA